MRRLGRLGLVATCAMAIVWGGAGSVMASHSVPSPLVWWDLDNDAVRDAAEGNVVYDPSGGAWTATKEARFSEAAAEWRNDTVYNPSVGVSAHDVYVDGTAPAGCPWEAGAVGQNCLTVQVRATYIDITDSDISLNENALLFNYSDSQAPPAQGRWDAEGVWTHELGHGIFLNDLYGASNCPTETSMCGSGDHVQSYSLRNITSDDVSAATAVY